MSDLSFGFMCTEPVQRMGPLTKDKFCFFFSCWVVPIDKGGKHQLTKLAPLQKNPFTLNYYGSFLFRISPFRKTSKKNKGQRPFKGQS